MLLLINDSNNVVYKQKKKVQMKTKKYLLIHRKSIEKFLNADLEIKIQQIIQNNVNELQ